MQALDALSVMCFIVNSDMVQTAQMMEMLRSHMGGAMAESALRGWGILATTVSNKYSHDSLFLPYAQRSNSTFLWKFLLHTLALPLSSVSSCAVIIDYALALMCVWMGVCVMNGS